VTLRAIVLVLALCPAAHAEVRQADQSDGRLEFSAIQAGASFTGSFTRFRVALDFDPEHPASGRLDVTVEVASIDTRDPERDEILRGPDFFQVEKHAQAVFHAGRFERAGDGWRAPGDLTIRGVTRSVPVAFTLAPAAGALVMKGSASLERLAFGLGQGEWASTEWVGDAVDVRFELRLQPVSAAASP
jgi:polyisoprenoid-binding protein YceI